MVPGVRPDVVEAPVEQGAELRHRAWKIGFLISEAFACGRLLATQSGNPGHGVGQRPVHRPHLAELAAGLARRLGMKDVVVVLTVRERSDLVQARLDRMEAYTVAKGNLRCKIKCCLVKATGVEKEHTDRQATRGNPFHENHVLR